MEGGSGGSGEAVEVVLLLNSPSMAPQPWNESPAMSSNSKHTSSIVVLEPPETTTVWTPSSKQKYSTAYEPGGEIGDDRGGVGNCDGGGDSSPSRCIPVASVPEKRSVESVEI